MNVKTLVMLFLLLLPSSPVVSSPAGLASPVATSLTSHVNRTQNKAAFIYNMSRFIDWKDPRVGQEGYPVIFAVMKDDSLGPTLKQLLEAKGLNGRVLIIRDEAQIQSAREFFNVFSIAPQKPEATSKIIKDLKGSRVLTVGETADFLKQGGMVQLQQSEKTLQFQLNETSMEGEGLKAEPVLKKMAGTVLTASPQNQQQLYENWKKMFDEAQAVGAGFPASEEGTTSVWGPALAAFKWIVLFVGAGAVGVLAVRVFRRKKQKT